MTVTSTDHGYKALIKRTIGMKPVTIAVGILEKDGAAPHEGGGDLTLIEIACFNEFGTFKDGVPHVPERSFIRAWFDENEDQLRQTLTILMRSVIAGKRTREQILQQMGAYCVGQIQQRIASSLPPPNADSTVKQKGSSTTLIDTGHLRSAISFQVKEGT
jgi:hypothetical protein